MDCKSIAETPRSYYQAQTCVSTTASEVPRNSTEDSESESPSIEKQNFHTTKKILHHWLPYHFDGEERPSRDEPRRWKTSLFRFGPLSGLFCMCMAVASIIASLGILVGSRGAAVSNWSVEPSAYIAIFTAIANQSIRYATIQGVAIAWWFRASRGSTLAQLHHDYQSGMTIRGALSSGRHFSLLGLACIFSTLVAIDGPLLQKATSVVPSPIFGQSLPINVTIAQEVPRDWGGVRAWADQLGKNVRWGQSFNETRPSPTGSIPNTLIPMLQPAKFYYLDVPFILNERIPGFVHGCYEEQCKAKIRAPAFAVTSCKTDIIPVDYNRPINVETVVESLAAPPLDANAFIIDISLDIETGYERVNLITAYSRSQDCVGELNMTVCSLESAIGEYTVEVHQNKVALSDGFPTIITHANNTQVNYTRLGGEGLYYYPSTLASIVDLSYQKWNSEAVNMVIDNVMQQIKMGGFDYEQYMQPSSLHDKCTGYLDPQKDVLWSLNQLMFIQGVMSAEHADSSFLLSHMDPDLPLDTTTSGEVQGTHNVFQTNFHWFVAAAAVEIICIAFIAPTYWGWWKLGRPVSFSPLEIGKALEAPLLGEYNSNSAGRDIAKLAGDVPIKYGATIANLPGGDKEKIAFVDPAFVTRPKQNTRFDV